MKNCKFLFMAALLFLSLLHGGDFNDKGALYGWRFVPLQVDLSLVKQVKLADDTGGIPGDKGIRRHVTDND